MKLEKIIKILIDFIMTILLLLLMAFQITGQEFHEWLGAGMLVLFLTHNVLNYRWYKNLLKGKYSVSRMLQTVVNLAVLVFMLCLAYSGIVMSHHVFGFVFINGVMALARKMHMAASYWGFVLMGIHLGFHWGMMIGIARNITGDRKIPQAVLWVLRIVAAVIAVYGTVCFYHADIVSYMFLKNQFAFFDFEQTAVSVLTENLAMMVLWVFVGYYVMKAVNDMRKYFKSTKISGRRIL